MQWLKQYTKEITNISSGGDTTEFSYRTAIDNMLKEAAGEFEVAADILQEPSRVKDIGAPDFRISSKSGGVIGYVECKKPGEDLHKLLNRAQVKKYHTLSNNILLTDCWHWALLRDGKVVKETNLTGLGKKQTKDFTDLLCAFMQTEAEAVGDAKRLAAVLAMRCDMLRDGLAGHEDQTNSQLHGLFKEFQQSLDADLTFTKFSDTFSQTLVYSLLLAKLNEQSDDEITLHNISGYIPVNYPVIRNVTAFLSEITEPGYKNIRWVVDDILAVINNMDAAAVSESMSYGRGSKGLIDEDDPYIHFYEDFLAAYDARLREQRGVYYTPPPVVKFIVSAIDDLLRRDFNLSDGLSESKQVTVLDFAAGTGTFLLEMARKLLNGKSEAKRDLLVRGHFLKNFYGFEFLISPYVIAHMKLSQFLKDNKVPLEEDERVNIFLTNTLEPIVKQISLSMMPKLADDVNRAQKVKDSPVLVITGNPPYAAVSQNKGTEEYYRAHKRDKNKQVKDTRHTWIGSLLHGTDSEDEIGGSYYEVDGKPLGEPNTKWLQDDYVKFIRFAQWKIEKAGHGMVAIITNHGFLDNPTFRGMRQSLLNTFDALYFIDMHGNAKKKEEAPDGSKDENVFDIQQGVAISLLVKNPETKNKGVFHADLWGKRTYKYDACMALNVNTIKWKKLTPVTPFYLFIPVDEQATRENADFYPVSEIFSTSSAGIVTARDKLTIAFNEQDISQRIAQFVKMEPEQAREDFDLGNDSRDWKVVLAQKDLNDNAENNPIKGGGICRINYRPFDTRFTCYTGKSSGFHCMPRKEVMQHMLAGENLGLVTVRQVAENKFNHALVVDNIIESRMTLSNKGIAYLFPLYRYDKELDKVTRHENLTLKFREWINDRYGEAHSPEDILACIYASLYSPYYRERHIDSLRIDFPRIPFPADNSEFQRLATIGAELIDAHLLRAHYDGDLAELNGAGSHQIEIIRYDENAERLYFNSTEWLEPVPPDVFNFQIGGYQPLDKFLKSRKGRPLILEESETLKKAANAIAFTIDRMDQIDQ